MAKRKATRLPFVVSPRLEPITQVVGTEESGKIEIIRRGYLTVAEKAFMQAAMANDESIHTARRLALRIARETGKDQTEVLNDFGKPSGLPDYLEPYQDELSETFAAMLEYQERRKAVAATCLLIYRVDPDWTIQDTMERLHPDLQEALHSLLEDEEAKVTDLLEQNFKPSDEEESGEGKPTGE